MLKKYREIIMYIIFGGATTIVNWSVYTALIFLNAGMNVANGIAWVLAVAFAVVYFVLNHTTFGRRIYATGSNAKCAKLVGVNTDKTKISVYAISGFLSALAGLLMISRLDSAQPTLGDGYELDAIAASALGGISMSGGRGKVTGTIAGVLIIAVLNNGLNIMNVSSYYQEVIKAIVILVAVLSDSKR